MLLYNLVFVRLNDKAITALSIAKVNFLNFKKV